MIDDLPEISAPDIDYGDSPDESTNDDAVLARLARLPPLEYERARDDAAEQLGIRRLATLDRLVKLKRAELEQGNSGQELAEPRPWPDRVDDGPALFDEIEATLRTYVVLPSGAAEALTLWVAHCHAHDAAAISPIAAVTSATPECGKTTLQTLLGGLVPKALPASNITAAPLFRAVEKWRPTLLIDEADTFLKGSDELRGILNSGHARASAFVIRTVGDDYEPRTFSTWAPKSIALIGRLPPTLASRSIHIHLRRKAPGETVRPLRGDRLGHLEPLCRRAWTWAQEHLPEIRSADPELPTGLRGRTADNWRPLFAIADVVGGDWPTKARRAAETLSAGLSEETAGIMVLDDIREMFEDRGVDRLFSEDIAKTLGERDDRPWSEWKHDKPITQRQLARLLEPFEIKPKQIRIGAKSNKGYLLEFFEDAFLRYPPPQSETSKQSKDSAGLRPVRSETPGVECFASRAPETAENGHCFDVSDQSPHNGACAHCGQHDRADDPIQDCYVGGDFHRLHRSCQDRWPQ